MKRIVRVPWLIAIALIGSVAMAAEPSPFSSEVSASTKVPALFQEPWAVASHGSHLWVVNFSKNIVELDADTGSVIRIITAKDDGNLEPESISYNAGHLWVISNNSVAELNASDGALIRVMRAKAYDFDFDSGPIDFSEQTAWVLNAHNESVTELDASSGALIRVVHLHIQFLSNPTTGVFYGPLDMAISGSRVVVSDLTVTGNQIIELNTLSGLVIRVIKAGNGPWRNTRGILAADGDHVWITGDSYGKLVDLDTRTGSVIRVIKHKVPVVGFVTAMIVEWFASLDNEPRQHWQCHGTKREHWIGDSSHEGHALQVDESASGSLSRWCRFHCCRCHPFSRLGRQSIRLSNGMELVQRVIHSKHQIEVRSNA
jgi:hypothetical protein